MKTDKKQDRRSIANLSPFQLTMEGLRPLTIRPQSAEICKKTPEERLAWKKARRVKYYS